MHKVFFVIFWATNFLTLSAQNKYSFDAGRCIYDFVLKDTLVENNHMVIMDCAINNYDSISKFYKTDTLKKVPLARFVEIFSANREITFLLGDCIEYFQRFPCGDAFFDFIEIYPKTTMELRYMFESRQDLSYYIKSFQINFDVRVLNEQNNIRNRSLTYPNISSFEQFYKLSEHFRFSINLENRKESSMTPLD